MEDCQHINEQAVCNNCVPSLRRKIRTLERDIEKLKVLLGLEDDVAKETKGEA